MNPDFSKIISQSNHLIIALFFSVVTFINAETPFAIGELNNQLILVLTNSISDTNGYLYCFERENSKMEWKQISKPIKVVIGRAGLAAGIGLHNSSDLTNLPTKVEGDGKSPAGIFNLSSVFGYNSTEQMTELKMPYTHISEMIECIDDSSSKFYNQLVARDKIKAINGVDWNSSEKMREAGIYYELGVVVDHNSNSKKGAGSCIFLHNWADSNETMAGCTAMAAEKMKESAYRLDATRYPIIVQLTKQLYSDLVTKWNLPEVNKDSN